MIVSFVIHVSIIVFLVFFAIHIKKEEKAGIINVMLGIEKTYYLFFAPILSLLMWIFPTIFMSGPINSEAYYIGIYGLTVLPDIFIVFIIGFRVKFLPDKIVIIKFFVRSKIDYDMITQIKRGRLNTYRIIFMSNENKLFSLSLNRHGKIDECLIMIYKKTGLTIEP